MKPNTIVMEREGDLGGEEIAMQIDAAATAHIMSVLTDLYSNTRLAVVREYSTNALDAHIAVGQTRPIEVTTPTAMSPFFKVKDYGIGLDVDDIRKIYSQYGASTKRTSDDFNGVLGLGCKSALTYTNQFTVTSVKDGTKTVVSVSRSQDGGGVMQVVSSTPTTEANFTEVTVPTRDHQFETEARNLFRFWKKGTVLLNGAEPAGLPAESKEVVPGIFMVPKLEQDYVVMGNVAYPCEKELYRDSRGYGYGSNSFGVVAFVSMGRVHFTPSREKLMMTPATTQELNRIRREFKDGLHKQMRDDIESASTYAEAYKRYLVWQKAFYSGVPNTYRGKTIPQHFQPKKDPRGQHAYPSFTTYKPGAYRYGVQDGARNIGVEDFAKAVLITEYDGVKISPRHKEKMNQWANDNNVSPQVFILTADADNPGSPWVEPATVTWEDIKAVKLPRAQVQRAARKAPYDVIQRDGHLKEESNITSSVILFVSPSEEVLKDGRYGRGGSVSAFTRKALTDALPGATIVQLAANRWDKFKRDYPNAQHVNDYARKHLTAAFDALTNDDKLWLGVDSYERSAVQFMDYKKIDDPAVVNYLKVVTGPSNARIDAYKAAKELARKFALPMPSITPATNPMKRYPLVDRDAMSKNKEHCYIYMNTVYAMNV